MSASSQWCGQTQPHDPHTWSQQQGPSWYRQCAGYTAKPTPGPCFHESGVTWPSGERPRCELLAGHDGAHTWRNPHGGESVWTETFAPTTHRPEESPDE